VGTCWSRVALLEVLVRLLWLALTGLRGGAGNSQPTGW
jgi:hypothetical protein